MTSLHHPRRRSPSKLRQRIRTILCLFTAFTTTSAKAAARHLSSETFASSNSSTCTRSKHVVLASFGVPEAYHTVSLYFASKFPDTAVHHLWLHLGQAKKTEEKGEGSAKASSSTNAAQTLAEAARHWPGLIKALAAAIEEEKSKDFRRKTPIDWRAFYRSHGIHRSVVDMSSIEDYHAFRKNYVHSSVNGYEYELLCFARFIGLRDFCTSKKIDQLTWIDADIPIFDPEFLDRVCLPEGYSTWALTSGSSFLNTMTCAEIGRFVDYMLDFYAIENRHALVRAIHAHGSDNMVERFDVIEQVRRSEPAFTELGIDPKHFSDMFLFSKFLQDTNNVAAEGREEQERKEPASTEGRESERSDKETASTEGGESEHSNKKPTTVKAQAVAQTPQVLSERPPRRAYIHQDRKGGTIEPYFLPILSIRNEVPHPDTEALCVEEDVWNRYYSLRRNDDVGTEGEKVPPSTTLHRPRLGLSFNRSGAWVPVAGAHFQGDDCKARLLDTFSRLVSEDPGRTML